MHALCKIDIQALTLIITLQRVYRLPKLKNLCRSTYLILFSSRDIHFNGGPQLSRPGIKTNNDPGRRILKSKNDPLDVEKLLL